MVATLAETKIPVVSVSRRSAHAGQALSGLAVAFLVLDSVIKFVKPPGVVDACAHLGIGPDLLNVAGVALLICTALYPIPRTSILGAILLTGYLGGAVMSHLRVGDPIASHVLFPTYVGALVWAALLLRDSRLRVLIPFRSVSCN